MKYKLPKTNAAFWSNVFALVLKQGTFRTRNTDRYGHNDDYAQCSSGAQEEEDGAQRQCGYEQQRFKDYNYKDTGNAYIAEKEAEDGQGWHSQKWS